MTVKTRLLGQQYFHLVNGDEACRQANDAFGKGIIEQITQPVLQYSRNKILCLYQVAK